MTEQQTKVPPLTTSQCLLYGLGHFGISLLGYMVVACVVPFYNPPAEEQARGAQSLVASAVLIAAILFVTRLIDLIADPLAGYLSDRTHSRWGRRKPFMAVSAPLLVASFMLLWRPVAPGQSDANAWYAGIMLALVFVFFAGYAAPYLGLLPEIARTPRERVRLATVQGVFHLLGTAVAALATGALCPLYGIGPTASLLAIVCLLALWLACLGPHEVEAERVGHGHELGLGRAFRVTLTNWPFLIYWAAYYLYWVPLLVVMSGMVYLASEAFGLAPGAAGAVTAVPLVGGLCLLPLARWLTERHGPRWTLLLGLLWLAAAAPVLALVGTGGVSLAHARLLAGLLSPTVAVLFTVPYTVLADICDLDYRISGKHREAMYFGFQGLMLKAGWGAAPLVIALIMQWWGEAGVRLFGPVAGLMALLGALVFWFYPERRVRGEWTPGRGASGSAQESQKS